MCVHIYIYTWMWGFRVLLPPHPTSPACSIFFDYLHIFTTIYICMYVEIYMYMHTCIYVWPSLPSPKTYSPKKLYYIAHIYTYVYMSHITYVKKYQVTLHILSAISLSLYIYICTYIYKYFYAYTYTSDALEGCHLQKPLPLHTQEHSGYVYTFICIYIRVHIHVRVYTHTNTHKHVYIYVYTWTEKCTDISIDIYI